MSFAMENLSSLALHQNANLSSGHPLIKEATLNWLAAAQVRGENIHCYTFIIYTCPTLVSSLLPNWLIVMSFISLIR
jgi:hypothetical protein